MDDASWSHFTISISQNQSMVKIVLYGQLQENDEYVPMLEYTDDQYPLQVKYFGVRSLEEDALWKVHKCNVLIC